MHGFVYFLSKDKDKYQKKSYDAVFDLQLAENKKLDLVTIQNCKKKLLIGSIHLFYILFRHGITHFNTNWKTGKPEIMLYLSIANQNEKILALVLTNSLQTQISNIFIGLGILKVESFDIIANSALYPKVSVFKTLKMQRNY